MVCYVRSCRTQSIHAVRCCAVLCCAVLCCAVLCCAVLCCAADYTLYGLFCLKLICRCASIYPQSRYEHPAVFHACIAETHDVLPERHSCDAQAERLQQYQDRIAQESEAVLLRAETQRAQSNLELLVNSLSEEQAEQSMEARYAAISAFAAFEARHAASPSS